MKNKRGKKQNLFSENYRLCFDFLKRSKRHILFSVVAFLLFAIIGFVFPIFFREEIIELLTQLAEKIAGMGGFELTSFIFLNNIQASFFAVILGVLAGLYPLFTLITNAYLIGFVVNGAVMEGGISVLWRLLPHGIFELPAIIISISLGLKIGLNIFKRPMWKSMKEDIAESMRCFLFVILPLLIIAAVIEGILVFYLM
jgi:stage II sporulation protein M